MENTKRKTNPKYKKKHNSNHNDTKHNIAVIIYKPKKNKTQKNAEDLMCLYPRNIRPHITCNMNLHWTEEKN